MKSLLCLLALACVLTVPATGCLADDPRPAKPAFKGIELYSWKDPAGDWVYVLLPGTNRNKDEKEVKAAKDVIKGADALAKKLARLAVGESVFWLDMKGFEYPAADARAKIEKAAKAAEIELSYTSRGK